MGAATTAAPAYSYRIAGSEVVSNLPLPAAAGTAVARVAARTERRSPPPATDGDPVVYDGEGWLEGRPVHARCVARGDGYEIAVAEAGRYWVAADGGAILELEAAGAGDALLGPPLLLALALRGTFALHAAAYGDAGGDGIVALCGPSGAGKSTLAAASEAQGDGLCRLADDLLPLASGEPGTALLGFPQLKLAAAQQPRLERGGGRVPLRGIVWLGRPALDREPVVRTRHGAAAVPTLVAASVASRLFPPPLAARHLEFCAALAAAVPVGVLSYPRRREAIPAVFAAVDRWLRGA